MINQIAPVPQETQRLGLKTGLLEARHIQARIKGLVQGETKPETGLVSSPLTGMPYLVPILRWIE